MSDTPNYVEWRPEYDGHAPPYWREGMGFKYKALGPNWREPFPQERTSWMMMLEYRVPPEALTAPNEDDADAQFVEAWKRNEALKKLTRLGQEADIVEAVALIRKLSPEELAKHGITLAPERDWATELWADLMEASCSPMRAIHIRDGRLYEDDRAAISVLRTRFEQMKGEG